ncbi:O-antigen ligase family protein [Aeromonas sp. SCS5]|uniref:O-antigen ligase family protein n=1 Tax=Aeromonas sp. SCS5 TaxID=1519205 RepID=UPI0009037522|nr:O-antigen ligase family protein [Aeromonas sp. SCS5]
MNFQKIEKILLYIFSASIFVSKPAITISTALLVLFFIYRCIVDESYYGELKGDKVIFSAVFLFLIGVLSRVLSPGYIGDVGYFFYKGLFLLAFPALVLALRDKESRKMALILSMSGFAISVFWSFVQAFILQEGGWSGQRVAGLWDVLRWTEITTFVFIFLLAKISDEVVLSKKLMLGICMALTFISLILSGGRSGWIAVIIVSAIYMLFFNRKYLVVFVVLFSAFTFSIYKIQPEKIEVVINRALSVTETTERDYSNYSRLLMWKNGLKWISFNASEEPMQFLFGIGFKNFEKEYVSYLDSESEVGSKKLIEQTLGNYSLRDLHNAYIDSGNKMGVLYTVIFYFFIVYIAWSFIQSGKAFPGVGLVSSFLIMGMFYANYIEYQTSMLFFLIAMFYSESKGLNVIHK